MPQPILFSLIDKVIYDYNLIQDGDKILIGGGMCFTFLKAQNINVGNSIVDDENIDFCQKILKETYQNLED